MAKATLKTLARHLDLSVTTVSRALKDGEEVHPDTILRVKQAAIELGYVPNINGVKLRTGRTYTIYALLGAPRADEVGDAGSIALLEGMREALRSTHYSLASVPLLPDSDHMAAVRRIVDARLADGIILDLTQPGDERVKYILDHGVHVVTFGRTGLATPHAFLDIDNEHAAYQATRHLIAHGHQRIALLDPMLKFNYAQQRLCGYRRAMEEASLALDDTLIVHGETDAAASRIAAMAMVRQPRPPTGFVCRNEVTTLGVIAGLRDCGRRVGPDAEIVSRDGTRLTAYLDPPVSACFYPLSDIGRRLATYLHARIEGHATGLMQDILRTRLIDRSKSAGAAKDAASAGDDS